MTNVNRLVIHKMSADAVRGGGFNAALEFLKDPRRISEGVRSATAWVAEVIAAVRSAAGPNPWRDSTDEEIAGELLRQVEAKRAADKERRRA